MKTLGDYTSSGLMVPELEGKTAESVIGDLCSLLQREGRLSDSNAFYNAVMKRERLSSTVIAPGWALPHARLDALPQLSFALARSLHPLLWPGAAGIDLTMVFLFAIPESEAKAYLNVIAAVARLNQSPTLVDQLLGAPDGRSMLAVLEQVPVVTRTSAEAAV